MCGIIMARNTGKDKGEVNADIINQYENQHKRGSQGFGIIVIDEDKTVKIHRSCEGAKLMFDLHAYKSKFMIMHHRQPTSTENKIKQTHPIKVSHGSLKFDYYVIHNGVITNDKDLRKKHIDELGFIYTTDCKEGAWERFNDSESLAIELARFIEKQTTKIGTRGSAAFIALQVDKETNKATKMYFGRNSNNPLKMSKTRGKLRLSSEGEGGELPSDKLYSCNIDDDMKLKAQKMEFEAYIITKVDQKDDKKATYEPLHLPSGKRDWKDIDKDEDTTDWNDYNKDTPDELSAKEETIFKMTDPGREEIDSLLDEYIFALTGEQDAFTVDAKAYAKEIEKILERITVSTQAYHQFTMEEQYTGQFHA